MSGKIGLFTGSFDPITKGHVDIIERASSLFDTLYVGIFFNPDKDSLFTGQERLDQLQQVFEGYEQIKILLGGKR